MPKFCKCGGRYRHWSETPHIFVRKCDKCGKFASQRKRVRLKRSA